MLLCQRKRVKQMNRMSWNIASFEPLLVSQALIGAFFEQCRKRRQDQQVGVRGILNERWFDDIQWVRQPMGNVFENPLYWALSNFRSRWFENRLICDLESFRNTGFGSRLPSLGSFLNRGLVEKRWLAVVHLDYFKSCCSS